jgi:hypothetical protein
MNNGELTAVCLLRDDLTPDNHRELLAQAAGKTKLQVLELLARRFPRPDVASTIRELPTRRDVPTSRAPAVTEETAPSTSNLGQAMHETAPSTSNLRQATQLSPSSTRNAASAVTDEPPAQAPVAKLVMPARAAPIEPLSAARYRIQLNASAQLKAKLEQAAICSATRTPAAIWRA